MHGRIFVPGIEEKKRGWQFSLRMSPMLREAYFGAASWAIAAYTRENILGESRSTSGKPNFEGWEVAQQIDAVGEIPRTGLLEAWWIGLAQGDDCEDVNEEDLVYDTWSLPSLSRSTGTRPITSSSKAHHKHVTNFRVHAGLRSASRLALGPRSAPGIR